ncbi:MAG: NfeD family protein [Holosporales bacterium]
MDTLSALLHSVEYWHWLIAMAIFLGLEVLFPGSLFLWLGAGALVNGLIMLLLPTLSFQTQMMVFSLISLASLGLGLWFWRRNLRREDKLSSQLNRRGDQLIGRTLTLETAIENGRGTAKMDDSVWRLEGPDTPAGTKVRIKSIDGTLLVVEPV